MKFLKFIIFIICIASFQSQSAISIRFKTKPTINTTVLKNCTISFARAALYSAYFTGGFYVSVGTTPEFTTDQYLALSGFFFGISIGHDLCDWIAPVLQQHLERILGKKEAQPQSPSSTIYSAAP